MIYLLLLLGLLGSLARKYNTNIVVKYHATMLCVMKIDKHHYYNSKRGNCYPGAAVPKRRLQTELKSRDFLLGGRKRLNLGVGHFLWMIKAFDFR